MAASSSSEQEVPVLRLNHQQLLERSHQRRRNHGETRSKLTVPDPARSKKSGASISGRDSPKRVEVSTNWKRVLDEWKSYERRLEKLCLRWAGSSDHLEQVLTISRDVERCAYELAKDTGYQDDITSKTWRSCHYRVIDKLRKFFKQAETVVIKESLKADLESFLLTSSGFYESLVTLYQRTAQFDLETLTVGEMNYSSKSHKHQVKMAVNSIHNCFLALGDLSRYSEELKDTPDWSKPRTYYLKSQELVPRDGKPYNQLAVIAINSHRRLDAVYFYCRSLWIKNSFLSAYDSLMSLFEETSRKGQEGSGDRKGNPPSPRKEEETHRQEVWLMPGRAAVPVSTEFDEFQTLEFSELSKKVTSLFLFVHSKLFTKIEIGQFQLAVSEFLSALTVYLKREEISVERDAPKILKMITVNVSTIYHILKNTEDTHSQAAGLNMSLSVGLQIVTSLIDFCLSLLDTLQNPIDMLTVDTVHILVAMATMIPSVRVWTSWISVHTKICEILLERNDFQLHFVTFFTKLCRLINLTQHLLPLRLTVPASASLSCSKYWEEKMLAGFSCLPSLANLSYEDILSIPSIHQLTQEQIQYQSLSRLSLLQYEIISHTSLQHILLYDSPTNKLSVILHFDSSNPEEEKEKAAAAADDDLLQPEEQDEVKPDKEVESKANTDEEIPESSPEILHLKREKERLAHQLQQHKEQQQTKQSLLDEARNTHSETIVKPRYLVPDTNCFVDHLKYLKQFLESGHFVMAVPLTVIGELEGLSKGAVSQESSSSSSVDKSSLQAVNYIKEQIATGSTRLKPLTSQGNILSSLLATSETFTDQSSNDDIILASCVKLHERIDSAHSSNPALSPSPVTHSVVLLTDDRNLRVKSHASHIPVRSVQEFHKMFQ